jgi:NitT/TauT family transport system substrate-binding protein
MGTLNRREFLHGLTTAGTAALLGAHSKPVAAEPPPETTRLRLEGAGGTCQAPKYVAEELLRAEGFTDLQYVNSEAPNLSSRRIKALSSGETDFDLLFLPDLVIELEKTTPIVILAGQHIGCFELFARGRVRAIRDLKHKTIAVRELGLTEHLFLSVILSYVGLDPTKDINLGTRAPFGSGAVTGRGEDRRRARLSSASAAAPGPEDWTRGAEQHDGPPLVATFLLHGGR